jgi:Family of unknown function (DUF6261)
MIDALNISILRNAEYIQYVNDVNNLIIQNNPEGLGVSTQQKEFAQKIKETESLFKLQLSSDVTEEIQALDLRRDNAINGIVSVVTGYINHFDAVKVKAANALNDNLKIYGAGIARENFLAETAIINSIVSDWENKLAIAQALVDLSITDWKDELKAANELFNQKYIARTQEIGASSPDTLKKKREETNVAYYELRKYIDAHGIINKEPEEYKKVVNELNALITQYNLMLTMRLSTAKKDTTPNV